MYSPSTLSRPLSKALGKYSASSIAQLVAVTQVTTSSSLTSELLRFNQLYRSQHVIEHGQLTSQCLGCAELSNHTWCELLGMTFAAPHGAGEDELSREPTSVRDIVTPAGIPGLPLFQSHSSYFVPTN